MASSKGTETPYVSSSDALFISPLNLNQESCLNSKVEARVSPGAAMLYPSTPCRQATP
jgi:hypothetical protein